MEPVMGTELKFKFYVVDLVRNKPKLKRIVIPEMRVEIEAVISVGSKKAVLADTARKRFHAAAMKEMEAIETQVREFAFGYDDFIEEAKKKGNLSTDMAEREAKKINAFIEKEMKSAKAKAEKAIKKVVDKEATNNALYKDAKVTCFAKAAKSTIKISAETTKLIASSGANVKGYATIAKELGSLFGQLTQMLKKDKTLREDLEQALALLPEGGKTSKVTDARKAYMSHTTSTRRKADMISKTGQKLLKKAKAEKEMAASIKVGAKAMQVKAKATQVNTLFLERQSYLDDIQKTLDKMGLQFDDRTTFKKLKQLDTKTISNIVKGIADVVLDLDDLVTGVEKLA
jgi:hypothetical protein